MFNLSFRTQYDRFVVHSPAGERLQPTYSLSVDDDGQVILSRSGQIDVYDKIQASRDSVELKTILERYATDGVNAIDVRRGFFADVTRLPSTLADFFSQIQSAEQTFNSLPVDVRSRFDHSLSQFVTNAGSPEWYNRLGIDTSVKATPADISVPAAQTVQTIVGGDTIVP